MAHNCLDKINLGQHLINSFNQSSQLGSQWEPAQVHCCTRLLPTDVESGENVLGIAKIKNKKRKTLVIVTYTHTHTHTQRDRAGGRGEMTNISIVFKKENLSSDRQHLLHSILSGQQSHQA